MNKANKNEIKKKKKERRHRIQQGGCHKMVIKNWYE